LIRDVEVHQIDTQHFSTWDVGFSKLLSERLPRPQSTWWSIWWLWPNTSSGIWLKGKFEECQFPMCGKAMGWRSSIIPLGASGSNRHAFGIVHIFSHNSCNLPLSSANNNLHGLPSAIRLILKCGFHKCPRGVRTLLKRTSRHLCMWATGAWNHCRTKCVQALKNPQPFEGWWRVGCACCCWVVFYIGFGVDFMCNSLLIESKA